MTTSLLTHIPSLTSYEALYKHLHANPEISLQESETATLIAQKLRDLSSSIKVTEHIGGHGLIGVLHNGDGPTILLRADFDALPLLEKTGLEYASKKTMVDKKDGKTKPVMHACGHDFHVTALLACAETLIKGIEAWSGTVVFLFQPAEEKGVGAAAMVDDGLYKSEAEGGKGCPIPDVLLGQHVFAYKTGTVHTRTGPIMAAADSWKITIHGSGGHGSMPHRTIDPIVIASSVVVKLQTIVSREVPPDEVAVVTVGSFQAGEAENIIPDEAVIKIDVRSFDEGVRKRVKKAIERIVKGECIAGNCPKEPEFELLRHFQLTDNEGKATITVSQALKQHFGDRFDGDMKPVSGSEDFSLLASRINKPYVFWFWGGTDAAKWEELEKEDRLNEVPVNHSPFFGPVLQPTLTTGVEAMVVVASTFLGKGEQK